MRIFNYPDAEQHPFGAPEQHPFGAHGVLLALPIAAALWACIIATIF